MAVNYVKLAKTAQKLIEANGRELTLVNESTAPADPAKPHRGRTAAADVNTTAIGIIRGYKFRDIDGENIKVGDKQCVIAADSLAAGISLSDYEKLIDDEGPYRIMGLDPVKPGETPLVYFLQLRR